MILLKSRLARSIARVRIATKYQGLAIACGILGTWMISLLILLQGQVLSTDFLSQVFSDFLAGLSGGFSSRFWLSLLGLGLAIWWQTFLYVGIFITAHDAMHGSVYSRRPRLNHAVGTIAMWLYALLSYKKLNKSHWQHHRYPASDRDPDFHDGRHKNPVSWYLHFMRQYWSWSSWVGMTLVYHFAHQLFHVAHTHLILFWVVPALLSSMQLFYFGTFLPHREPLGGYPNENRAVTIDRSIFWSFLTCYHFGYHLEHHEYPELAWWQLPAIAKR